MVTCNILIYEHMKETLVVVYKYYMLEGKKGNLFSRGTGYRPITPKLKAEGVIGP